MSDDYQGRVKVERAELELKISKLEAFTITNTYALLPEEDKQFLDLQLILMKGYSKVLEQRIWRFK